MKTILEMIRHHLWIKVMLALLPFVLLVFGFMIFSNIQAQNRILDVQTAANANLTATAIEGGMFDALAIGNNDTVRTQFARLHEEVPGLEVHIFDFNGDIAFATQVEHVGDNIAIQSTSEKSPPAIASLLSTGTAPEQAFLETIDDTSYLSIYRPILNEARCYHCHGKSRKVLGGIHVRTSTESTHWCGGRRPDDRANLFFVSPLGKSPYSPGAGRGRQYAPGGPDPPHRGQGTRRN